MIVTAWQSDLLVCNCNENATVNGTENSNRPTTRQMQIEGIIVDKCLSQDTQ